MIIFCRKPMFDKPPKIGGSTTVDDTEIWPRFKALVELGQGSASLKLKTIVPTRFTENSYIIIYSCKMLLAQIIDPHRSYRSRPSLLYNFLYKLSQCWFQVLGDDILTNSIIRFRRSIIFTFLLFFEIHCL